MQCVDDDGLAAILDSLATLPPIGRWVTDAACRGHGDVFTNYPRRPSVVDLVEQTCGGCPVRAACLAYAAQHDVDGVWAGKWHNTRPHYTAKRTAA